MSDQEKEAAPPAPAEEEAPREETDAPPAAEEGGEAPREGDAAGEGDRDGDREGDRERSRSRSHSRSRSRGRSRSRSRSRDRGRSPGDRDRSRSPARRRRDPIDTDNLDKNGYKLYVGNLDFKSEERDLEEKFSKFGSIMDVYIPREPGTWQSRGFAFVTFTDKRDAEDAVEDCDGREWQGRVLKVNLAKPRPPIGQSSGGGYRGGGGYGGGSYGGGGGGYGRRGEDCRDYKRNMCDRGDRCRFEHDDGGRGGDDYRRRSPSPRRYRDDRRDDRGYDRGHDRDRGYDRDRGDRDRGDRYDRDRY